MGGWAVKGKRLVPKTKHRDCLKKARGCLDRASVVVQNDEAELLGSVLPTHRPPGCDLFRLLRQSRKVCIRKCRCSRTLHKHAASHCGHAPLAL
jgi:hypothetical protein